VGVSNKKTNHYPTPLVSFRTTARFKDKQRLLYGVGGSGVRNGSTGERVSRGLTRDTFRLTKRIGSYYCYWNTSSLVAFQAILIAYHANARMCGTPRRIQNTAEEGFRGIPG